MPVPLFDRRQGSIEAAEHRVRQAQADYRAVRIDLVRRLGQAHQALLTAQQEVHTLQQQSLPAARRAYRAVVEGYRIGRFGYLEQIDAQRSLFTAIQRTVEARSSYFQNLANIEFLVATNLFSWEQQQQQLEKKSEPSSAHPASQPASQPESGSHNGGLTQ